MAWLASWQPVTATSSAVTKQPGQHGTQQEHVQQEVHNVQQNSRLQGCLKAAEAALAPDLASVWTA